jgi:hypothetical protein
MDHLICANTAQSLQRPVQLPPPPMCCTYTSCCKADTSSGMPLKFAAVSVSALLLHDMQMGLMGGIWLHVHRANIKLNSSVGAGSSCCCQAKQ